MPGSGSTWPIIVLAVLLVLVLGASRVPALARTVRSLSPSRRRPPPVFGADERPKPRNGHSGANVEESTERLPVPELPVTPGRPPYATSMFAAITDDTPRPDGVARRRAAAEDVDTETVRNLTPAGERTADRQDRLG